LAQFAERRKVVSLLHILMYGEDQGTSVADPGCLSLIQKRERRARKFF
jgi:hypothetical protein